MCFVICCMTISRLTFSEEKSLTHLTCAVIANMKIVKKHNEYFHLHSKDYEGQSKREQSTIVPKLFK